MHSVFNIWKIHAVYIFSLTFSPSSFNLYQQPEQLWIEIHTYSFPDSSLGSSSPLSPLPWAIPLHWWLGQWRICLQCGIPGFDPWVGKIPWRRESLPTPGLTESQSRTWLNEFHFRLHCSWGCQRSQCQGYWHPGHWSTYLVYWKFFLRSHYWCYYNPCEFYIIVE